RKLVDGDRLILEVAERAVDLGAHNDVAGLGAVPNLPAAGARDKGFAAGRLRILDHVLPRRELAVGEVAGNVLADGLVLPFQAHAHADIQAARTLGLVHAGDAVITPGDGLAIRGAGSVALAH